MEHIAEAPCRAGAGKADVELAGILPFDGFDAVRHPLAVRALVLEDKERICVVALELTSIRPDLLAELRAQAEKASGVSGAALWVVATHTFSAPHARTPQHLASDALRQKNDALRAALGKAVFSAVSKAMDERQPACVLRGSGTTSVMVNRDVETERGWWLGKNPAGPSDHRLFVLSVQTPEGGPIATVFSADVQSSVLKDARDAGGQTMVSGDLAGAAAAKLEQAGAGIALFIEGCAADQAPRESVAAAEGPSCTGEADAVLGRLGSELARDVQDALASLSPVPGRGLAACAAKVLLPGKVREDFATLAPRRSIVWRQDAPVATTVSFLRIGSCVLAGLEPEVSSSFGAYLRDAEAGPEAVFTMVNGAQKYLADEEDFDLITYEAMNSGFAREAASQLRQAVLRGTERMREGGCA